MVREVWQWVRKKVMELLGRLGPPPVVSNEEFILAMFPKCTEETSVMFILGNYIQVVDDDAVNKQKELREDSMLGVLEAKLQYLKTRAVPQPYINLL